MEIKTVAAKCSNTRRIITRSITRHARLVFPFLDLPAEVRNFVYEYAIDIDVAEKLLHRYYQDCKEVHNIRSVEAPLIYSKAPTILQINRQIFAEATYMLRKQGLTFEHGLLDLADITEFVPKSLFRTISSVTITDAGHPLFQSNIERESWTGYMALIEQLGAILTEGHNLKNLTISLSAQELVQHVTTCWNRPFRCGYRDSLRHALNSLRTVHNVRCVTFHGIPEALASVLKTSIESPPISLLSLPRELRDQIYAQCADWSDTTQQLFRTMANWVCKGENPPYPKRTTPTILLLNKQIHAEAQPILREKPLTMVCPADHGMLQQTQVPNMMRFISKATLLQVQHVVLKLESWEWIYSFDHLFPHLAASISLKSIQVYFKDDLKTRFLSDPSQQYPDATLHTTLGALAKIHRLESVVFAGDLPDCYTMPLVQIMQSAAASTDDLPKLYALKGDGSTVEIGEDEVL